MDWKEAVSELRAEVKSHAAAIRKAARDSDRNDRDLEKFIESEIQDVVTLVMFAFGTLQWPEP